MIAPANVQEQQLRAAMALNRGTEFLETLQHETSTTVEHHEARRIDYLVGLFQRTHKELFADWKGHEGNVPGLITDPENRRKLREAVMNVLCANGDEKSDDHLPEGLFDANGFVVRHDNAKLASILAKFYAQISAINTSEKPLFSYGNKLTLDFFMVALSKLPAFSEVYPSGIDFRRLDKQDLEVFYQHPIDKAALKKSFEHALDGARTKPLDNTKTEYTKWEKHIEYVSGVPFLSHKKKGDPATYLLTVNGGLVLFDETLKKRIEKHFEENKLVSDFVLPKAEITGYITSENPDPVKREKEDAALAHIRDAGIVDGFKIKDGAAPLFCTNINIMTGLHPASDLEFMEIYRDVFKGSKDDKEGEKITNLNGHPEFRDQLLAHVATLNISPEEAQRKRDIIETAYQHINYNVPKIDSFIGEKGADGTYPEGCLLYGKKPVSHPNLFICMGGAGSGKTSVKHFAKSVCGDNYVTVSLDDFRSQSDLYNLMLAANHHADDYLVAEPYGKALRTWAADRALSQKFNLLYDGTGISYQPGYSKIAKNFKEAGFKTYVVGVDAPLLDAIDRVDERFKEKNRALPWLVVTGKHTRMFHSFLQAVQDKNIDKAALVAADTTAGEIDKGIDRDGLIAETSDENMDTSKGGLVGIYQKILNAVGSTFKGIFGNKPNNKSNELKEGNVTYLDYPVGTKTRTLAIYNTERFTALSEKGLMNPHASSPKNLYHTPATMPFYMPRGAEEGAWRLKIKSQQSLAAENSPAL